MTPRATECSSPQDAAETEPKHAAPETSELTSEDLETITGGIGSDSGRGSISEVTPSRRKITAGGEVLVGKGT